MILVTGREGLVGSHVCEELSCLGREYRATDKEVDIQYYGLVDELISKVMPDTIIHTAAITHVPQVTKDPDIAFAVNVRGTFNLLAAARNCGVKKFVYISSASVLGDVAGSYMVADETFPIQPKGLYGVTKACGELLTKVYGVPYIIIRLSSVYGPHDTQPRVIPNFIKDVLHGRLMKIESDVKRDFTYVKDAAQGIVKATLSGIENETYHITGGVPYSIIEIAKEIRKQIGGEYGVNKNVDRIQVDRGAISIKKAQDDFGYEPKYDLSKGIKETIKWIKSHFTT